ncbi:MAG: transcription termination/antitermination protein NusA [Oscillospiraceae bacterium]|nr:transcription termination/antitermination protein NusA [Oscillospiraceae bacterium]
MNNKEFFDALELLAQENGIPMDLLVDKIKQGISRAVKKEYPYCEDFLVDIVPEEKKFEVTVMREVVDDTPLDMSEIHIDEAKTISEGPVQVGDVIPFQLSTAQFGRVAAQNAKQAIRTEIKTFEREKYINQFSDKLHEAVSATVQRVEPESGNATLTIDKNEVYLYRNEQIPGETLKEGDIVKLYIADIINPDRKPMVKVSRTHRDLVKRLFELEIPEIYDGTVEVKSISREAGSRSKIAVCSKDKNVDPVGACIGPKHSRIGNIVNELRGEKIDIIVYDEDPEVFIAHALAPAEVLKVEITDEEQKTCSVTVPNSQLSLAIGNRGQNAKLAARLTGYRIDIKPENPDTQ